MPAHGGPLRMTRRMNVVLDCAQRWQQVLSYIRHKGLPSK